MQQKIAFMTEKNGTDINCPARVHNSVKTDYVSFKYFSIYFTTKTCRLSTVIRTNIKKLIKINCEILQKNIKCVICIFLL